MRAYRPTDRQTVSQSVSHSDLHLDDMLVSCQLFASKATIGLATFCSQAGLVWFDSYWYIGFAWSIPILPVGIWCQSERQAESCLCAQSPTAAVLLLLSLRIATASTSQSKTPPLRMFVESREERCDVMTWTLVSWDGIFENSKIMHGKPKGCLNWCGICQFCGCDLKFSPFYL